MPVTFLETFFLLEVQIQVKYIPGMENLNKISFKVNTKKKKRGGRNLKSKILIKEDVPASSIIYYTQTESLQVPALLSNLVPPMKYAILATG